MTPLGARQVALPGRLKGGVIRALYGILARHVPCRAGVWAECEKSWWRRAG